MGLNLERMKRDWKEQEAVGMEYKFIEEMYEKEAPEIIAELHKMKEDYIAYTARSTNTVSNLKALMDNGMTIVKAFQLDNRFFNAGVDKYGKRIPVLQDAILLKVN